jgi:molybdate transport system permease protein
MAQVEVDDRTVTRAAATSERLTSRSIPGAIRIGAAVGLIFLAIPILGVLVKAPWSNMAEVLADDSTRQAIWLSVWTSTVTTMIALVIGIPVAFVLARAQFRGRALARSLVILPLVLPPVVGGVALLAAFGRSGLVGRPLFELGSVTIPFTWVAVVMAQLFVSLPFLVITVEGALRTRGRDLEEAGAVLGLSESKIVTRITLPMIRPAIVAGAVLCWALALGEFGATITFAGSLPGVTQTLPTDIYYTLARDPGEAIALSMILIAICVLVLWVLRGNWAGQVIARD